MYIVSVDIMHLFIYFLVLRKLMFMYYILFMKIIIAKTTQYMYLCDFKKTDVCGRHQQKVSSTYANILNIIFKVCQQTLYYRCLYNN